MSVRIQSMPDEFYHVYNRGVDKRIIFSNSHDYQRFLLLILLANDSAPVDINQSIKDNSINELILKPREPIVSIHAFSLLSNHYHLLITPLSEGGIAKFMQKIATGYTMYFNSKNERTGALFQGKYKLKHIQDDIYLRYLFEYIHLNPIREQFNKASPDTVETLVSELENNPWTSVSVYSGNTVEKLSGPIINPKLFFDLFESYQKHRQSLYQWKKDTFETFNNI